MRRAQGSLLSGPWSSGPWLLGPLSLGIACGLALVAAADEPDVADSPSDIPIPFAEPTAPPLEREVIVSAKACLWFAWAGEQELGTPDRPQGPYREDAERHRPVRVDIPPQAERIRLTAVGRWSHHPGNHSGPAGLGGQRKLETDRYRQYPGGRFIEPTDAGLNQLVGMWQFGAGPPDASRPAKMFPLGEAEVLDVPAGATVLWLGFHDGYEWSNNAGQLRVKLKWLRPRAIVARRTERTTVSAQACLWFAFAAPDALAGGGERPTSGKGPYRESFAMARPRELPVPDGAETVTVEARGRWAHGSAGHEESGPDGKPHDVQALTDSRYRDRRYGGERLRPIKTNLNKLLGLWRFDPKAGEPLPKAALEPFEIGSGVEDLPIPPGATALLLGSHDAYEWSNNRGQLQITVFWNYLEPETERK